MSKTFYAILARSAAVELLAAAVAGCPPKSNSPPGAFNELLPDARLSLHNSVNGGQLIAIAPGTVRPRRNDVVKVFSFNHTPG